MDDRGGSCSSGVVTSTCSAASSVPMRALRDRRLRPRGGFGLEFVMASWPGFGAARAAALGSPEPDPPSAVDSGCGSSSDRPPQGLAPDVRLGRCSTGSRASIPRSRRDLRARRSSCSSRSAPREPTHARADRAGRSAATSFWTLTRVLDAPRRLPLRARGRARRAAPLDHPRRPPRSPERPAAPGHAAVGERAAGARSSSSLFWLLFGRRSANVFAAGFLAGYLVYDMPHYHLHHHSRRRGWAS